MNQSDMANEFAGEVRKNWGWLLFMGIALIILGCIGLYMTGTLTLASVLYFGIMVVAAGLLMLIDAFKAEGWKEKIWEILIALVYVAAGIIMVANPGASAVWFTMFIAAFLLVSGVFRIIMGFQMRNAVEGWIWTVLGGFVSILLAAMIFAQWPVSGIWVIGMFVAIELLMQGISMVSIAFAAKASKNVHEKAGA
jgi:uncharacterized membrane protein HdeD (DUF308 family)